MHPNVSWCFCLGCVIVGMTACIIIGLLGPEPFIKLKSTMVAETTTILLLALPM